MPRNNRIVYNQSALPVLVNGDVIGYLDKGKPLYK